MTPFLQNHRMLLGKEWMTTSCQMELPTITWIRLTTGEAAHQRHQTQDAQLVITKNLSITQKEVLLESTTSPSRSHAIMLPILLTITLPRESATIKTSQSTLTNRTHWREVSLPLLWDQLSGMGATPMTDIALITTWSQLSRISLIKPVWATSHPLPFWQSWAWPQETEQVSKSLKTSSPCSTRSP